jgi:hypothetical protein
MVMAGVGLESVMLTFGQDGESKGIVAPSVWPAQTSLDEPFVRIWSGVCCACAFNDMFQPLVLVARAKATEI